MIPSKLFFTKGIGVHKVKLASFELALREAGIEKCNLVRVSSIFPPGCKLISREEGLSLLKPGQITFVVMAKNETDKPNQLISAAVGLAIPKDNQSHGYLSEYTSSGQTAVEAGTYAEDLATTMLTMTLNKKIAPEATSEKRKKANKVDSEIFKTHVCQSAEGNKNGLWTTITALAVLIV
jgi:arginine decarboxylase